MKNGELYRNEIIGGGLYIDEQSITYSVISSQFTYYLHIA